MHADLALRGATLDTAKLSGTDVRFHPRDRRPIGVVFVEDGSQTVLNLPERAAAGIASQIADTPWATRGYDCNSFALGTIGIPYVRRSMPELGPQRVISRIDDTEPGDIIAVMLKSRGYQAPIHSHLGVSLRQRGAVLSVMGSGGPLTVMNGHKLRHFYSRVEGVSLSDTYLAVVSPPRPQVSGS